METKIELKRNSFEYIIYKMVLWYIEFNKVKSTEDFNYRNDFTKVKMRCLPFIVCMASIDREKMFAIFDSFFASRKYGMLEKNLIDYPFGLYSNRGLRLENRKNFSIENPEGYLENNMFDFGQQKISTSKKDFCTEGVPYELIDKAIERLKVCNIHFVNHEKNVMLFHSKRHICWQTWTALKRTDALQLIPLDILLKEKSCYSPISGLMSMS
ncbi:MAG: hypothetical protein WC875_03025 [Candidatus Absconditabacterales bacterium]|jgi:hypothetical protein